MSGIGVPVAVPVRVHRVRPVSRSMVRITVTGDALRDFRAEGADQWLRLFLPQDGQDEPVLPEGVDWWPATLRIPEPVRPIVRNYSVRRARPQAGELDVDVVLHADSGPGTRWAARVAPGDRLGILDQSTTYAPPTGTPWQLLLADESALPALGSIVEGLAEGVPATAYIEIPTAGDIQELVSLAWLTVHWLPRGAEDRVGRRLVSALRRAELPAGTPYVWLAGEQRMVRDARRHLVGERGYSRSAVCFMTYWRLQQPAST